jgi:hypothetical protein
MNAHMRVLVAAVLGVAATAGEICTSDNNVFHVLWDLYASELGTF